MSSLAIYYTTFGNIQDAKRVAKEMIQKKYAACANILTNVISIYEWQAEVCETDECVVIFKTSEAKADLFYQELNSVHPYDVPCIIRLSIDDCNKAFAEWIADEVC